MAPDNIQTKDVLSLEDLEAAGHLRTGRKHILALTVENKPGVLTRIAGLFARRGFNIDTLAVGPTEDESVSRITLTLDGAVHQMDQVTKQLHKLVNVLKIRDLDPDETLARELALFKVQAGVPARRATARIARSDSGGGGGTAEPPPAAPDVQHSGKAALSYAAYARLE